MRLFSGLIAGVVALIMLGFAYIFIAFLFVLCFGWAPPMPGIESDGKITWTCGTAEEVKAQEERHHREYLQRQEESQRRQNDP